MNNDQIAPSKRSRDQYHHGDLRAALIEAGEAILIEKGVEGFSLREAARRAGVSAGAPAYHFGEARGLLTAIAALGFKGLYEALSTANAAADAAGDSRLKYQGKAYIRFALAQPQRFHLMWRHEALNPQDATYTHFAQGAFNLLQEAALRNENGVRPALAPAQDSAVCAIPLNPRAIAAWSLVHGFAVLALLNSFNPEAEGLIDSVIGALGV